MKNNVLKKDIWELYGVRENPFSTSPLLVIGGAIPLDSFVGRGEDIKRLSKMLSSKGGSRTFVYGDIGVGKTSFVNVVRSSAFENGFFTHFKEITTQDSWSADEFILNTLSAIYSTLKLMKDRPVKDTTYKKLESLFELSRIVINSIGVSILGIGANGGNEQRQSQTLSSYSLHQFFTELIEEINSNTKKEIIIHYNNLELVSEKKLRHIFDTLRDFFQTRGVHFIFIGNLTAYSILQSVPRFASILDDTPFHIEPLSLTEVNKVIRKRFEGLKLEGNYNIILPFTEDCLKTIYNLMGGNIRYILNSLGTAVFEITGESPVVLDSNKLSRVLNQVLEKRYLSNLTLAMKKVLNEIVKHEEITNKALSDKLKIRRSNISTYIKDLESAGCVYLRRKNGKDKFWKADPKIKWSLLKETPQQSLNFSS